MVNKFRLGNPMQYAEYIKALKCAGRFYEKSGDISEKAFDFPYTLVGDFSDVSEKEQEIAVHNMLLAVINNQYHIDGPDEATIEITVPLF